MDMVLGEDTRGHVCCITAYTLNAHIYEVEYVLYSQNCH